MGLRRVLFLAKVDSRPFKSQDLSSGWIVVIPEVKSWRILPAISDVPAPDSNRLEAVLQPLAGA
jgi:hypothetical protein